MRQTPLPTLINVSSLALGIIACQSLIFFIFSETTYDDYHENGERIYRLQQDRYKDNEIISRWAAGCAAIGPSLENNFDEIENYAQVTVGVNSNRVRVVEYEKLRFRERKFYYATPSYLDMFTIDILSGKRTDLLQRPYTVILSSSLARKYFKGENPIGKVLKLDARYEFEITGVYEDFPSNSHFKPDALMSYDSYFKTEDERDRTSWWRYGFHTYILVKENTDIKALEARLYDHVHGILGDELKSENSDLKFNLQKVSDIHLDSNFIEEFEHNGSRNLVYFLVGMVVILGSITAINYLSLLTMLSFRRSKEVGIRKVLSGGIRQLISQFIIESIVVYALALLLAALLFLVLYPIFTSRFDFRIDAAQFSRVDFWLWFLLFFVLSLLLSITYPLILILKYNPTRVLRGRAEVKGSFSWQNFLIGFEYATAVILCVWSVTIYLQIYHVRNSNLEPAVDNTVVLFPPNLFIFELYEKQYRAFKNKLAQYPEIGTFSSSSGIPGDAPPWTALSLRKTTDSDKEGTEFYVLGTDKNFSSLYDLKIVAGENYTDDFYQEYKTVLVNEKGAQSLKFNDPEQSLGKKITFWSDTFTIVGVVANYHHESPKRPITPMVFRSMPYYEGYYSVKLNTNDINKALQIISGVWKEYFADYPFDYFFLTDYYRAQYKTDELLLDFICVFSGLAVVLACLGLLGLLSVTILQKRKEIEIRKVHGATTIDILVTLTRRFFKIAFFSILIGVPISWLSVNVWLDGFANKIQLDWWMFLVPCAFVTLVLAVIVGFYAGRMVGINVPASFKYD